MTINHQIIATVVLVTMASTSPAEWSGYIAAEGRAFFQDALDPQQSDSSLSISAEPEYFQEWQDGRHSLIFKPFFRIDQQDDERTHADIRELTWTYADNGLETRLGIGKVYWGVTEAYHLVDIINQTDLLENPDGEQKLGQPMLKLSLERDWGILDLYLLPGFRERTFPGDEGRLRTHPKVDSDRAQYESSAENKHVDAAIRWSQYFGDWDVGLAHFYGTGRDPLFSLGSNGKGEPMLIPFYEIIDQTSIDVQATKGEWLWKFEGLYRRGLLDDYYALTGGFEYTSVGIFESASDLGMLAEFMYDQREDKASTPFNHDIFIGLRWTANDEQSSELLAGVIYDWENEAKLLNVEASRRIGQDYKLSIQARAWLDVPIDGLLQPFNRDDYLQIELARYF